MRFATVSELKNEVSKIVHQAEQGNTVVILRHGKPKVAVVPLTSDELDQLLFETSPVVHRALQEALNDVKTHRTVTLREYLRGRRSA